MPSSEEARKEACLQLFHCENELPQGQMRLIVDRNHMWTNGMTLTVTFYDDPEQHSMVIHPKTPRYRHLVEHYASMWERWANIKFKFVDDDSAIIRITSAKDGSYSAVGTTATDGSYDNRRTMNLDLDCNDPVLNFSRTVSHEFGHAIGCKHEQLNPNADLHWIPENVVKWYHDHTSWKEKSKVYHAYYNFEPMAEARGFESSQWDPKSIMHYPLRRDWTREGVVVERSKVLSEMDKKWIGKKYPFSDSPVTGAGADKLLDRTSYAVIEGFEYRAAKMYLNLFCQSDSYSLYRVTYLFKNGSPQVIESDWDTERIELPLHGAAAPAPGTPLTAIGYRIGDFKQIVHLFYLDREDYIRDCIFVNGELKCTNELNAKAASYSRLSAVNWRGEDEEHIRLFYQSEQDDHIQEYVGLAKWNGHTSAVTWSMGAYVNIGNEHPLPGSGLSFVNLTWDSACIRGFYQNTEGNIRETKFTGGKWSVTPNWMVYVVPYATSFAAMASKKKGVEGNPILYYRNREYPISDDQYIYKVDPSSGETEAEAVSSTKIGHNSRMAFVDSDIGRRLFFTSPDGKLVEKVSPKHGESSAAAERVKFDWISILENGGGDDGW
ncbi:uncharacterized protein DFL_003364 [Arthrobotrys flagrans]|uniref:Peptidase M12A domain-containing protein n=1 Tax=Arthrobotrys flagrans TaxID=97331 RepID=A0A437A1N6_ARTFL|nr:hypothetical protein DFL_003364 [Arthrobotrys flagrans]